MSDETNDFKPLADADDATSQQPVAAAADYPATGAVAGTAATNNSATGNAADRATDEPAKPAKSSKPSISMSDLPDLRATFDPDAPLDDSSDRSRDEFTTVYDIIDSIEEELDEAKPILFAPSSVRVDRESFTGKLDKLKKMLPVQLERASALMRESERRLESAQTGRPRPPRPLPARTAALRRCRTWHARAAVPSAAACTARLSAPSTPSEWLPDNGIKHRNPAIDGWQGFFYYYQVIRRLHCDLFPHAIGVQHTLLA